MIRPSTRCSRSWRLRRRNSVRRRTTFDPVVDVDLEQIPEAEHARLAVDQGDVVDPERVFHRGQSVKLLEHGLGVEAAAELDDQAHPVLAVGQVEHVMDTLQLLGPVQVLDPGDHLLRADAVGEFGDHDAVSPGGQLLDPRCRPGPERAPAALVGIPDAVQADDLAARRQVRAGHEPHQLVQRGVGIGDQVPGGRDDLGEVVRGHVGRHADSDSGRAVDQQVGQAGREHLRLNFRAVVVGDEIDGVLIERRHHFHGGRAQPALGVAHRRRRVVE